MLDTLAAVRAIGLTAQPIGVTKRIVVIRMEPTDHARTYVNPTVIWTSEETEVHEEGSVSLPGIRERIERPARIRLTYQDVTGEAHELEAAGFEAAVLLHEIDQLDGVFWIDRLSRLRRDRIVKRYVKAQRG